MRKLLILRPEPGATASVERAHELGLEVVACPLFRVEPVAWDAPDPNRYDALLLTSANALRYGGKGLQLLQSLPVLAVGEATAAATRAAGFKVDRVGQAGLAQLLAEIRGSPSLLHLSGEDHHDVDYPRIDRRIIYRAAAVEAPALPSLAGLVVAVHSSRAGSRLAELVANRDRTAIAAISAAAADACGAGWEQVEVAEKPEDACLLALAAMLCHTSALS